MTRAVAIALWVAVGAVAGLLALPLVHTGESAATAPTVASTATTTAAPALPAPVAPTSASSTPSPFRWDVTQGRTIWVAVPHEVAADAAFLDGVISGLEAWRSIDPLVRFQITYGACPADGRHCVPVYRAPMDGAVTTLAAGTDGLLYGSGSVSMGFDSAPWDQASLANGACHEVGHVLGLDHSVDGTLGPCQDGVPTPGDLALVRYAYAV